MELSITLAHGSPYEPEAFNYIFNATDASRAFQSFDSDVVFVGHSRLPQSYAIAADYRQIFTQRHGHRGYADGLVIESGSRYIVNVGSVGQPGDGDPFASYALLATESRRILWRRVSYDVASV